MFWLTSSSDKLRPISSIIIYFKVIQFHKVVKIDLNTRTSLFHTL